MRVLTQLSERGGLIYAGLLARRGSASAYCSAHRNTSASKPWAIDLLNAAVRGAGGRGRLRQAATAPAPAAARHT